jgi:hypothetical protein
LNQIRHVGDHAIYVDRLRRERLSARKREQTVCER